jgi:3-dehydro-L-gulonate 2-dehydrogenase
MKRIHFSQLKDKLFDILIKHGFQNKEASQIALIFTESTFDGVFSHGINRFPRFIQDVEKGIVIPGISPSLISAHASMEQWDGLGGAGISNALFCSERSMELADQGGMGCVGLRNTNHWMRGGSYGWKVAGQGYLFMGWTNTMPNMPPWGGTKAGLGNNPFVMAIPYPEGPIVLDMAMSQYAYGKLEWHVKKGTELDGYGGFNKDNELTRNPAEILETGRILPTGLWKGSAMALVLDLAAAILSGGNSTREIGDLPAETSLSQVFISVDVSKYMSEYELKSMIESSLEFIRAGNKEAQFPGQGSLKKRQEHRKAGVELPEEVWAQIEAL